MAKVQKIRIEIDKPGRGKSSHELERCPLKEHGVCRLEFIECKYGLTEISVPKPVCPLSFKNVVTLKISAI